MPTSPAPSTSRRLLALLALLQARRDWPTALLAERLGVSERTIRRDIDRLRELDYTIEATRGRDGGYRLGAGAQLPPMLFDDDQAVALALALQTAHSLGGDIGEAAERALATVTRTMPSRLAHRIRGLRVDAASPSGAAPVSSEVLLQISAAIAAEEELRFDYASPGPTSGDGDAPLAPRRTEPHHLVLHTGRWYLIGFTPDRDHWRLYRADRIALRTHRGGRFTRRTVPGGDPIRFLTERFRGSAGGTDAWPCEGEVTVHAAASDLAPYVDDGALEELGSGWCRIRLGSWSWGALAAAFARFDADLGEAHPAELRAAFATLERRSRALHGR